MSSQSKPEPSAITPVILPTRRRSIAGLLASAGVLAAGCTQNSQYLSSTPPPNALTPTQLSSVKQ